MYKNYINISQDVIMTTSKKGKIKLVKNKYNIEEVLAQKNLVKKIEKEMKSVANKMETVKNKDYSIATILSAIVDIIIGFYIGINAGLAAGLALGVLSAVTVFAGMCGVVHVVNKKNRDKKLKPLQDEYSYLESTYEKEKENLRQLKKYGKVSKYKLPYTSELKEVSNEPINSFENNLEIYHKLNYNTSKKAKVLKIVK